MKKIILGLFAIIFVVAFFSSCEEVLPISKTERIALFVADLQAGGSYSGVPDNFSEADMTNDWGTVTSGSTYWDSPPWDNMSFVYTVDLTEATKVTTTFAASGGGSYKIEFYFVKDSNISGADVWLIYQIDIDDSVELY